MQARINVRIGCPTPDAFDRKSNGPLPPSRQVSARFPIWLDEQFFGCLLLFHFRKFIRLGFFFKSGSEERGIVLFRDCCFVYLVLNLKFFVGVFR